MRAKILLFLTTTILAGIGGFAGSVLGNAGGRQMLFVGGVVGGLVATVLATSLGVRQGWVPPERARPTALYACAGFLVAVLIIVNTLHTPLGALLSPALVGLGALVGAGTLTSRARVRLP